MARAPQNIAVPTSSDPARQGLDHKLPPIGGSENFIAAYAASLAHHGNVVRTFSANFVNVFALFNAGAFGAVVAVIPSEFGQHALKQFPYLCHWILVLYALGFILSTALMSIVFSYSLRRYRYYREILIDQKFTVPLEEISLSLHTGAYIVLVGMLAATVTAIAFSLAVIVSA